jgi:hypothetical protein
LITLLKEFNWSQSFYRGIDIPKAHIFNLKITRWNMSIWCQ